MLPPRRDVTTYGRSAKKPPKGGFYNYPPLLFRLYVRIFNEERRRRLAFNHSPQPLEDMRDCPFSFASAVIRFYLVTFLYDSSPFLAFSQMIDIAINI